MGYKHSPKWHKHCKKSNNSKINRNYSTATRENHSKVLNGFLIEKNLKPVMCYEDLQLEETKNNIKNCCKDKSGIYLIK